DGIYALDAELRKLGAAGVDIRPRRSRDHVAAGPGTGEVVAGAVTCGKPLAVHLDRTYDGVFRIVHRRVAHRRAVSVGKLPELLLEIVDVLHRHAADLGNHRSPGNRGARKHVTRIRDVDAGDRAVVMPRLLERQVVDHRIAELEVFVG